MFVVNNLISYTSSENEKVIERVLWLNKAHNYGYFFNVYSTALPYEKSISEVEEGFNNGSIVLVEKDPFSRLINENNISEKHLSLRDNAWEIIKDIVKLEPFVYHSEERRKLILKRCEAHNIHESTVIRYLKKYWQRGKTKNALLPDYYLCGGKGKEKKASEVKRGRPRKHGQITGEGINIDENIKRIFRSAINKHYLSSAEKSLALTYELMLKEHFSLDSKVKGNVEIPVIKTYGELPTLNQFRYWFEKQRDIKKEISQRKGRKKYEQNHRAIIGESTTEALGPGAIYQIDATVGDLYLLSRFNREWIIGRPVIYSVMDVYSRMIVGLYIGLEGPSWAGAMMALANAASDKVNFCRDFGIEIEKHEWPVEHLPESILADRGELEGSKVDPLINNFGIRILNTPSYRADLKGIIEQHFRVTNSRTKAFLPGAVKPIKERGDRDYRLEAQLDIYQFTQVIIKCVLYHNNHHYLTNYQREEMMVEDGIESIPIRLWEWGINNKSGKLRHASEDIVKLNLMPTGKATVTAKGIAFKGLLYGSKQSLKDRWFEQARNRGTWKIDISYDPRNMDYIYIRDENGLSFDKCFLLEHQQRYRGKVVEEIDYLLEYEKVKEKQYKEKTIQEKVDLNTEIEEIVKQAKQETSQEQTDVISKRSRIGNIRQNRAVEKMIQREEEAFELDRSNIENSKVVPFNLSESKEFMGDTGFDLLLRKQKEALNKIDE
ncbi:transposase [Cytobacillus oceanisediminis]|uniref:Mu transposase C-terminal domain-containing protein n=1 Tax=Bacillaceae TaxID=186817 RepID=UPI001CCC1671|nr:MULTISPECIES: Mu transposase C-terminal domain-containing protein [Bacillaceae]MBZ9536524.1 transposase [Cytobacillus oceanisediminis]UTI43490.1 Mu transposase C-terminal domain-containing protein [Niallia sp. RD1]